MDKLMSALMEGLPHSKLDYEIIDVSNGEAWVEVGGVKFTVRVEERDD
jgi:hypothetical protein